MQRAADRRGASKTGTKRTGPTKSGGGVAAKVRPVSQVRPVSHKKKESLVEALGIDDEDDMEDMLGSTSDPVPLAESARDSSKSKRPQAAKAGRKNMGRLDDALGGDMTLDQEIELGRKREPEQDFTEARQAQLPAADRYRAALRRGDTWGAISTFFSTIWGALTAGDVKAFRGFLQEVELDWVGPLLLGVLSLGVLLFFGEELVLLIGGATAFLGLTGGSAGGSPSP